MEDIGSETSCADDDITALVATEVTGELEQFEGFLQGDGLYALLFRHLGKTWLLLVFGSTDLYHGSESSNLHKYGFTCLGIHAQLALSGFMLSTVVECLLDDRLELLVEHLDHVVPFLTSFGNLIEVLLYLRREVIVHDTREELHEEVVDNGTYVGRQELAFLGVSEFLTRLLADLLSF